MKRLIRLFFVVLVAWTMFALTACSGSTYYGVSSYHRTGWDYDRYNRYDYYDDRRDRYVDNRNKLARRNYYHQRTNPNRGMGHRGMGHRGRGHSRRR